ncbi:hypothetical protein R1sor_002769 [Riccia sorocarpa]|uniref:Uncharacterized protein n=1 Tax=Riccia sorocarpa TaxID=122646 RepID=A0ABD3H2D9_9MARC
MIAEGRVEVRGKVGRACMQRGCTPPPPSGSLGGRSQDRRGEGRSQRQSREGVYAEEMYAAAAQRQSVVVVVRQLDSRTAPYVDGGKGMYAAVIQWQSVVVVVRQSDCPIHWRWQSDRRDGREASESRSGITKTIITCQCVPGF